jgi:phage FluMu protein Com
MAAAAAAAAALSIKHPQCKRSQQTFSKLQITTPIQNLAQLLKHVGRPTAGVYH